MPLIRKPPPAAAPEIAAPALDALGFADKAQTKIAGLSTGVAGETISIT